MVLITGRGALFPSPHNAVLDIISASCSNRSISSGSPFPSTIRSSISSIRFVPSRHGTHLPQLNDDYFYCFGCGATGDVIDFVARLFQIGTKEAAEKIAADFGLLYDRHTQYIPSKRTATAAQIQKQRERYTYGVLARYHRQLQEWMEHYSPESPEQEIDLRYVEAVHQKDYVEYLMDIFLSGDSEERALLCAERNPDIRSISHRLAQLENEKRQFKNESLLR